jgi:NAD(P)-dependent dehydrogenase (short-subunit alcohol dehydrogenase family)
MTEIAVVTGATGSLGAEVARTLSRRGCRLVLVDSARGEERLTELAGALGSSVFVAGDVTDDATWSEALDRSERELGGLPALAALIAGGWQGGKPVFEEKNEDAYDAMSGVNLGTVHRSLRAVLPAMVAGHRGSVVVVGSRAAVQPWTSAGSAMYAASKAAVVALAQAAAAEVLEAGVRINAVLPSTMDTPANRAAIPSADATRWVTLESAAGVVAFLLSDDARDISGAAIPLYGRA